MTSTSSPDGHSGSPTGPETHVREAYLGLRELIRDQGNERLRNRWPEWDRQFRVLMARAERRPDVTIALVGGTGAGKSTLLNALIGVRILPVSNMRACTAAICEVAYAD